MKLVFLLEEPSAREMLHGLLPRLLPDDITYQCVVFEGKSDLEKKAERKMRAWLEPDVRFVILRDQDSGDCRLVKKRLQQICTDAGRPDALIRIACRELESWYLADLKAVEKGLEIKGIAAKYQEKKKFRQPDYLGTPSAELDKLTGGLYQKVNGSRAIGPHLETGNLRSSSFHAFVEGIRQQIRLL